MQTYSHRIALVISDQHLIPHGGVGQFAKSFSEMAQSQGCVVDLVLDKEPLNLFFEPNGRVIHPAQPLPYRAHQRTFAFSESVNTDKASNFRTALMQAHHRNLYDLIVINTPEALLAAYLLGLHERVPTVAYSHLETLVFRDGGFRGIFSAAHDDLVRTLITAPGITVGTQTARNVDELARYGVAAQHLPMPLPERGLLEAYDGEREGVLWIGRWEDRKDPKAFVRAIRETGLPARVMTSERSAIRFRRELPDADIRVSITGNEKVDMIRSSRVLYMPSRSESYGFAVLEAAGHCHVVTSKAAWTANWDADLFTPCTSRAADKTIATLYGQEKHAEHLERVRAIDAAAWVPWRSLMISGAYRGAPGHQAACRSQDDFYLDDWMRGLDRKPSIEDVRSVLNTRNRWQTLYTADRTWLSSSGAAPVRDDLFTF